MPQVRLLDKELAELIAAGEVIERPSSVIKELVENSIDSGASAVTVEIKNGGISYIRITDNGCGMSYEDVPIAFMRHATSKLREKEDLAKIMTLGFRGEALASICAVSRTEVFTKPLDEEYGTHYVIEGTEQRLYERTGCPDGTTIIVRDIFYNVPARLKFLKKDKYEGNSVASMMDKIAVSHPEVSFRFIRNNQQEMFTPGDNQLFSSVYSVFGKEFAASLLPVKYRMSGIRVDGYTVKPLWSRKNRSMQHFYINGRYVKSLTCMCALDEAYRNMIMEGKFPACVLNLDIPPNIVDVNVHPAKTEVRFADEKLIYDCVYFAVKNALLNDSAPTEMVLPEHKKTAADYAMPQFSDTQGEQLAIKDTSVSPQSAVLSVSAPHESQTPHIEGDGRLYTEKPAAESFTENEAYYNKAAETTYSQEHKQTEDEVRTELPVQDISEHLSGSFGGYSGEGLERFEPQPQANEFRYISDTALQRPVKAPELSESSAKETEAENKPLDIYFRIIGEAFKNYAIAETDDGILIVDKHAAHERILFERLRSGKEQLSCQMLLEPVELRLDYSEFDALVKNKETYEKAAFMIEPNEAPSVLIKGIPSILSSRDAGDIVTELAENFVLHRRDPLPEIVDDMYHTIACRSAIKANDITGTDELKSLLTQILTDERIRYCPHGRPVMFKLTKKELEKQFRRIV